MRRVAMLREQSWSAMVAMLAVVVMMVLGGGIPGILTTILIGMLGLVMLAFLPDATPVLRSQPATFRIGLLLIAVLPLLQLVPLPPSVWHALPGQALRIQTMTLAGLSESWQPLSVVPAYTAGAAVIAIAFVALTGLLITLPATDLQRIGWVILGVVALNFLIGLMQVASDGQAFAFYQKADRGAFIGFYTNKNHAALVLAASVPIAAYMLGSRREARGTRAALGLYAGLIAVALVTTNSRAGIVLGLLAMLATASLYVRSVRPAYLVAMVVAVVAGAMLISTTAAFDKVFSRFGVVNQDLRWQYLETSRWLIDRFWLFGAGIGSFSTLYAVGEPLAVVKPGYVNQLHDEYPQLLIEAGLLGVGALVALVGGVLQRGVQIWKHRDMATRLPLFCGALILVLIALHSAVDYPLRRPAVLPILAFAIALTMRGDLRAVTGIVRRTQRA